MISISEVYRRYKIKLVTVASAHIHRLDVDSFGPRDAGIRWPNTVIAPADAGVEDLLHELTHLVTASCLEDVSDNPENDGQLQLEWAISRLMSKSDRKEVFDYALQTQVQIFDQKYEDRLGFRDHVGAWKHPRRSRWWREGKQIAIKKGLLNPDGTPTWKRVKFSRKAA